jgi:hypothetical protein
MPSAAFLTGLESENPGGAGGHRGAQPARLCHPVADPARAAPGPRRLHATAARLLGTTLRGGDRARLADGPGRQSGRGPLRPDRLDPPDRPAGLGRGARCHDPRRGRPGGHRRRLHLPQLYRHGRTAALFLAGRPRFLLSDDPRLARARSLARSRAGSTSRIAARRAATALAGAYPPGSPLRRSRVSAASSVGPALRGFGSGFRARDRARQSYEAPLAPEVPLATQTPPTCRSRFPPRARSRHAVSPSCARPLNWLDGTGERHSA